jgi:GT2 family glycosyltransferase
MNDAPILSIVIVNYNSASFLRGCLSSIYSSDIKTAFEIIVYDNGDPEPEMGSVMADFPVVRFITDRRHVPYAAANNAGTALSDSEYILFLNPDTVVKPGSIDGLLGFIKNRSDSGAVGPRLVNGDNVVEFSYAKDPSILSEFYLKYVRRLPSPLKYRIFKTDRTREVDAITGAALMIRRKAFDEAGGFDEEYPLYLEDFDLCRRIREKGWKVFFFHGAEIVHFLGAAGEIGGPGKRSITEREIKYRIGQLRYYKKHTGKIQNLLLKLYLYFKFGKDYLKFRE